MAFNLQTMKPFTGPTSFPINLVSKGEELTCQYLRHLQLLMGKSGQVWCSFGFPPVGLQPYYTVQETDRKFIAMQLLNKQQ